MRLSERNKQPVYYALYQSTELVKDENDLYTGEAVPVYAPVACERMVVGINTGSAVLEQFGINDSFSVKLATDNTDCPIDTSSVMWLGLGYINKYVDGRTYRDGDIAIKNGKIQKYVDGEKPEWNEVPYNHAVVRVSKSLGYITYLVKDVSVS